VPSRKGIGENLIAWAILAVAGWMTHHLSGLGTGWIVLLGSVAALVVGLVLRRQGLSERPAVQNAARTILKAEGMWPHWWEFWRRRGGLTRSQYEGIVARETRAQQIVNAAEVTYRGSDWGHEPLWTIALPTLNASLDIHAFTEEEAREKVTPQVAEMLKRRIG
jgi:hypothetical protein